MGFITFTAKLELVPVLVVVLIVTYRAPDAHPTDVGTLKYGLLSVDGRFEALDA
jgi:hypothetical protein